MTIWPAAIPATAVRLLEIHFRSEQPAQVTVVSRGHTPVVRLRVKFQRGGSLFAKIATDHEWIELLRAERDFYTHVHASYLPKYLGYLEGSDCAVLLLEDLSRQRWPPPWSPVTIQAVCKVINEIADTEPPPWVKTTSRSGPLNWSLVAESSAPFLSLGLCSAAWLEKALPTLIRAEENADYQGNQLTHMEIRSDNLCLRNGKVIVIDWDSAALWHPRGELANWLPSLHAEGGPAPEELLPNEPELAALLSGYWGRERWATRAMAKLAYPRDAAFST